MLLFVCLFADQMWRLLFSGALRGLQVAKRGVADVQKKAVRGAENVAPNERIPIDLQRVHLKFKT